MLSAPDTFLKQLAFALGEGVQSLPDRYRQAQSDKMTYGMNEMKLLSEALNQQREGQRFGMESETERLRQDQYRAQTQKALRPDAEGETDFKARMLKILWPTLTPEEQARYLGTAAKQDMTPNYSPAGVKKAYEESGGFVPSGWTRPAQAKTGPTGLQKTGLTGLQKTGLISQILTERRLQFPQYKGVYEDTAGYKATFTPQYRKNISDSLQFLRPEAFGEDVSRETPPPENDGSMTPQEYERFKQAWYTNRLWEK